MTPSQPVLRVFFPSALPDGLDRLRRLLPSLVSTPLGFEVPLDERGPEEILALLLRCGVSARATRIMERPRSG